MQLRGEFGADGSIPFVRSRGVIVDHDLVGPDSPQRQGSHNDVLSPIKEVMAARRN
jgi:hypothetical protein